MPRLSAKNRCALIFGEFSHGRRCCQSNTNPSPMFVDELILGAEKVAPLAKIGVTQGFEPDSDVDVPFEVEVIVH